MPREKVNPILPPGLALAWEMEPHLPRRGPKPGHSVQSVIQAALELADSQGLAAVSLPNVARCLGFSTNAIYRYVASKDELLALLYDVGCGMPPKAPRSARSWRRGARLWTLALIELYRRRPWLLDVPIRSAPMTPNVLHWLEVFLELMDRAELTMPERVQCAQLLDGYARSTARLTRDLMAGDAGRIAGPSILEFLLPLLQQRELRRVHSVMGIMLSNTEQETTLKEEVHFGLDRILDGIEVLVGKRSSG